MITANSILANRYKIVRLIGGGGMKNVYLAEDLHLNSRHCAVAEMIDAFQDAGTRAQAVAAFQREAKLLAGLQEAHIPSIFDSFNEQNNHYLVMEYVEGETLEQLAKSSGGRLAESEVTEIALEILQTLVYLHGRKPPIIYRDLKPSNVMVAEDGSIKLIDFGIARYFQPAKTATMIGTQGYASPEQYQGKAEPRSDLYSLGALMHHLLSGRDPSSEPPFSFPQLSQIVPGCSVLLTDVVNRALQYDLATRISSAAEFRLRLTQARDAQLSSSAATVRTSDNGLKSSTSGRVGWLVFGVIISVVVYVAVSQNSGLSPSPESTPLPPSPNAVHSTEPSIEARLPTPVETTGIVSPSASSTPPSSASGSRRRRPRRGRVVVRASPRPSVTASFEVAETEVAKPEPSAIKNYFTIGSSKDGVLAVQGNPTGIINGGGFVGDTWNYGFSSVEFTTAGYVKGYSNITGNLHVRVKSRKINGAESSYFGLGSTQDEVLVVQGTPTGIISGGASVGDTWSYGFSSVNFSTNGTVVGYSNIAGNLRVRVRK